MGAKAQSPFRLYGPQPKVACSSILRLCGELFCFDCAGQNATAQKSTKATVAKLDFLLAYDQKYHIDLLANNECLRDSWVRSASRLYVSDRPNFRTRFLRTNSASTTPTSRKLFVLRFTWLTCGWSFSFTIL